MYCYSKQTAMDFSAAEQKVRELLKEKGFGIITEIDVQKVLKEKIGAEMGKYKILGACNPKLAQRALATEPDIGVLLPCNIVLREDKGAVVISAILPTVQLGKVGNPDLAPLAEEVEGYLKSVLDEL